MHDVAQFVRLEVQRGPHIEQHAIPVQAFVGFAPGLKMPNGGQRFSKHALQMRQMNDVSLLIAHRRQVADFCAREEPLVFRIVARNSPDQVHIFRGRQALDIEVVQPP